VEAESKDVAGLSNYTSLSSSSVIMPAPASVAAVSVVPSPAPVAVSSPTISTLPSEIDSEEMLSSHASDDDNMSNASDLWEVASRVPSPDQFVMVYESSNASSDSEDN